MVRSASLEAAATLTLQQTLTSASILPAFLRPSQNFQSLSHVFYSLTHAMVTLRLLQTVCSCETHSPLHLRTP